MPTLPTVVIPREAKNVPCPNCGRVLRNLATLGVRRQVPCLCGCTVIVERRAAHAIGLAGQAERRKHANVA